MVNFSDFMSLQGLRSGRYKNVLLRALITCLSKDWHRASEMEILGSPVSLFLSF